jgi:hypothetical protein
LRKHTFASITQNAFELQLAFGVVWIVSSILRERRMCSGGKSQLVGPLILGRYRSDVLEKGYGHVYSSLITSKNCRKWQKRGIGCTELGQSSTYQNGTSAKWDLLCDQAFDADKILQITYTDTFGECLKACTDFDQSAPCLGVQYGPGNGTFGELAGSNICYLMWNMTNGTTSLRAQWDSARLQQVPLPTVLVSSCLDKV